MFPKIILENSKQKLQRFQKNIPTNLLRQGNEVLTLTSNQTTNNVYSGHPPNQKNIHYMLISNQGGFLSLLSSKLNWGFTQADNEPSSDFPRANLEPSEFLPS